MIKEKIFSIFKRGSRTYFYCSLFFPENVKSDVFTLYSFVRTADNFVDALPQQRVEFLAFRKKFEASMSGIHTEDLVIDSFTALMKKKNFKTEWVTQFLDAMEQDLIQKTYHTLADVEKYMYGSAEVIGLMMAKILGLPTAAYSSAQYLGKSMQYVNFIRDISEDLTLGRTYFPQDEIRKFGLTSLERAETQKKSKEFSAFMRAQIAYHKKWSALGEKGFSSIPKRYLIPIKTANDLYTWTAQRISENPAIVYEKKMKPSTLRILVTLVKNFL